MMSIELHRNLKGCEHPKSKLQPGEPTLIRKRHGAGETQRHLAREYRVSQMLVWRILIGLSYTDD